MTALAALLLLAATLPLCSRLAASRADPLSDRIRRACTGRR